MKFSISDSYTRLKIEYISLRTTLKFDIYAMVKPKTEADVLLILDEMIMELKRLNEILDSILEN